MADKFKKIMHSSCGPGGIHCKCCNIYKGKEKNKLNRLVRARLKHQDKMKRLTENNDINPNLQGDPS